MRSLSALLAAVLLVTAALPAAAAEGGGRQFLSLDYQSFPTFGKAVYNSLSPTNFRANTGAVVRNTLDPLNPARYVTSLIFIEAQRQLAAGKGIDVGAILGQLSPAGIAAGYVGAQGGELVGAGLQSILAKTIGPIGGIAGFALRPVLWYIGSTMGQEVGRDLAHGEFNPDKAAASTLRAFNPVTDVSQMVGDGIGSVIGQALIPIPLVGAIIGGGVGGTLGLLLAKAFLKNGAGETIDDLARRRFADAADLIGGTPEEAGPVSHATSPGSVDPAGISTATLGPEGRAAYRSLVEALSSGDADSARKAYQTFRGVAAGE